MAKGRKEGTKNLTKEVVEKIWGLHEGKVGEGLIADTIGVSVATVRRVITSVSAVIRGEDLDAVEGGRYYRLKDIALELYGGRTEEVEDKPDEPREEDVEKVREYASEVFSVLQEMTALLAKQNELLEKFCSAFGVK